MWQDRMTTNNIEVSESGFYVDDGRVFMNLIRPGWRWVEGGLWFCREWEEEDTLLTNIEVSKRAIGLSMDGMVECLAFTVESQVEFPDNWLPTLT